MSSDNRGEGDRKPLEAAQDPAAFALCRRRLERALALSCEVPQPWPGRVAAAIRSALAFAAADPVAARVLSVHAAHRRLDGGAAFATMVDDLAALLDRDAPPVERPLRTARGVVTRIARQVLLHLETRPQRPVGEIAPDLIVFALTSYTGFAEAQRWAADLQVGAPGTRAFGAAAAKPGQGSPHR